MFAIPRLTTLYRRVAAAVSDYLLSSGIGADIFLILWRKRGHMLRLSNSLAKKPQSGER